MSCSFWWVASSEPVPGGDFSCSVLFVSFVSVFLFASPVASPPGGQDLAAR